MTYLHKACCDVFGLKLIVTNDTVAFKMLFTSQVVKTDLKKVTWFKGLQSLAYTLYVNFTAPKSCQDLLDFGVTESGSYMIDPDGGGTGAPPFQVFCNFDNGEHLKCAKKPHETLLPTPYVLPLPLKK